MKTLLCVSAETAHTLKQEYGFKFDLLSHKHTAFLIYPRTKYIVSIKSLDETRINKLIDLSAVCALTMLPITTWTDFLELPKNAFDV